MVGQREIQMPSPEAKRAQKPTQQPETVQVVRLKVPRYNWNAISQENRARIERGDKLLAAIDIDEVNAIEEQGEYYYDKYSETRNHFQLVRRERLSRGAV